MKIIVVASLTAVILSGCTSYQLSSRSKTTVVDKISPNTVTVTFCGNAYMKQEEVEKLALQRASLEALEKGCSNFVIVNKEDKSRICALGSGAVKNPGNLAPSEFIEPNVTLTIQCVREGEKIPENTINAQQFLNENFPGLRK